MIPLSTLVSRVRIRYEAESGVSSPTRWQGSYIIGFINEGLESLAEATGFYERYCTVPIEADRTYYDLRGFTPETVSTVRSVWSTTRNDWVTPINPENLPNDWELATGEPLVFFTRGIFWVGIHPHPATTAGFLRVHFAGIPSRFTHVQAVLGDLPDQYYPALEDYALYEMAALDGRPNRAIEHFKSYMAREKTLRDYIDRRLVGSTAGRLGKLAGRI